jgi:thiamine-monophosphate kinase
MPTLIGEIGELALVERLRRRVGASPAHVNIGIGDDAAAIANEPGMVSVVTTDALVEGVHFRRDWTAARAIGHKALAVNLSDLAAMGAAPRASLLSLALPGRYPLEEFDALVDGYVALADHSGAALVGGNLTSSPGPVVVNVTAIGAVRRRRVLRRHNARAGHELYVSGAIGGAAAGLALLRSGVSRDSLESAARDAVRRYEEPDARYRLGWMVGRMGSASAAMDLSDGLAATARAMAEASGVGVVLEADAIPLAEAARAWAASAGLDPLSFALSGGEDYELAFAVPPRLRRQFLAGARRARDLPMTRIGRFVADQGAWLAKGEVLSPLESGFQHWETESVSQIRPKNA